nr:synaptotagmin-8 [Vicugna pacos]
MGHPPDPHSVPAPRGTSAGPGLVPDLITRIPWPHWALVVAAVLAGVLLVSCLLCAFCCCCRHGRHRKKPRDKEAVGLGRARGTTTTHLVQPDVDNVESGPGGPQQWGRLQLSLEYDFGSQEIKVGLRQAADLRPGGLRATADPYARVSLSPPAGHSHETKVHRSTLCPEFDETCCFHVSLGSAGWGPRPGGGAGSPLQHWADMLAHAQRPVVQWHRLQPARDVDRALALQPRRRLPLPGS